MVELGPRSREILEMPGSEVPHRLEDAAKGVEELEVGEPEQRERIVAGLRQPRQRFEELQKHG
jgi:hypothetical protein